MISTRGRYALRVMIDLAEHSDGNLIALKDIAERQEISVKYLEQIMSQLTKANLLEGIHGKGGGYRLNKSPSEYKVGDILKITEGSLSPVACLCDGAEPCSRSGQCRTISMWRNFYKTVTDYFDGISVGDLMKKPESSET